jgi:hypothetical protein
MTETVTPPTTTDEHAQTEPTEPLFDAMELRQFGADDVEAGQAICKMLSMFFFYTVIVMALATYITYRWVSG